MKRFFALCGLITIAIVTLVSANGLIRGKKFPAVNPIRDRAVQVVYATGTVEASVMYPIAPRSTARLMELFADEGSEVKKDQILARLEDTDLRQTLNELRARLALAKSNFERADTLIKQNAISRSEFDSAQSEYKAAQAAVAASEAQLSYMTLRAPEAGRIIRRDGEIGQLIAANQTVFWMSCCAPLRISAEVDEEDISLVQPGQKVLIRADAFPGRTFNGTVNSITPKGDPIARSYRVRIGFDSDAPLMIGMTAETNIITREKEQALLLPSSAVVQNKIWIAEDGRAHTKKVEVGAVGMGYSEILSGIDSTEVTVLYPSDDLEEGMKIRAKLEKKETA